MHSPVSLSPCLSINSLEHSSAIGQPCPLRRLLALAAALLLVIVINANLFAQQMPDSGQYPPVNTQAPDQAPDNVQYAPENVPPASDRQSDYDRPQSYAGQSDQQAYPQLDSPQAYDQAPPLGPQDLEQLVAPIALYPDALVAQILTASTYSDQVVDADRWLRQQRYVSPDQIAAGADAQPWDPSVKALTAFPQVLAQMDQNFHWTFDLGNAYYNEPQDVLQVIQVMRRRAQAAGSLQTTPQETVYDDQGSIELAPPNPQVVYVPVYNPWAVYGAPIAPYPGFSLLGAVGSFIGSSLGPLAVRFGLGIVMTAFTHTPFGLLAWGLNWLTQSVLFHGAFYFSHSLTVADWGLPHGGPRAFSRGREFAGWANANRGRSGYGGYGHGGFPGARSPSFARNHNESVFASRSRESFNHGYQGSASSFQRPPSQQGYNRFSSTPRTSQENRSRENRFAENRSPHFGSSGYGSNYSRSPYGASSPNRGSTYSGSSYRSSSGTYAGRSSGAYGNAMRSLRGSGGSFQHSNLGKSSSGFKSNNFAKSSGGREHSSGFHFGSSGHAPKSYGGGHAPKSHGGGKSFSYHSGGSGHGGSGHYGGHGHSGGKHH